MMRRDGQRGVERPHLACGWESGMHKVSGAVVLGCASLCCQISGQIDRDRVKRMMDPHARSTSIIEADDERARASEGRGLSRGASIQGVQPRRDRPTS